MSAVITTVDIETSNRRPRTSHKLLLRHTWILNRPILKTTKDGWNMLDHNLAITSRTIAEDEAVQISKAVKAIGLVWSQQEKKNQYGAVYGLFYSQFEITSYKLLPARRFREAMTWLTQWYIELTGKSEIPF